MSQQKQQDKIRIPQDCPALQAVRAAKGVADCNRRYASLLTATFEASDMWCDLTQDELLELPPQLNEFATKMRLLREDLRFAQEDLLIEWTTRTADAAHSTLVNVQQLQCAHRQAVPGSPSEITCSAVPLEELAQKLEAEPDTPPLEPEGLSEGAEEPPPEQRQTGSDRY